MSNAAETVPEAMPETPEGVYEAIDVWMGADVVADLLTLLSYLGTTAAEGAGPKDHGPDYVARLEARLAEVLGR